MKKFFVALLLVFSFSLYAQSSVDSESAETGDEEVVVEATKGGLAEIPAKKKPKPIDKEKAKAAAEKDETKDDEENFRNTIRFGIPSEISELMDKLLKNEDPRFTDEIYDLFYTVKTPSLKSKILTYFTNLEDPCLEDFAVEIMNDPYDERGEVVKACFKYIQKVHTKEAVPAIIALIESENETYFNDALATIGEIGSSGEAVFLAEYLDREDLSDGQRQTLMRTLGKMHAVETYDKLVDVLNDEDENAFVRMYAAESLGLMQKKEAVPVLVQGFGATDPNLRQYIIKGLSNFKGVVEAEATIIQGVRDEHWRVREESIKAVKEMELKDSVPYLIYRIKNDSEKVIKDLSISTLAYLNTKDGNDFLVGQLKEKKLGDGTKVKITEALLKEKHAGKSEIIALVKDSVTDDRRKPLRYGLGKEIAKYKDSDFAELCVLYLSSKDAQTIGLGLDMYKTGKYSGGEPVMRSIYADKKANSGCRARIKKMLEIPDEEEPADKSKSDEKTSK